MEEQDYNEEEIYSCPSCGYEGHSDEFGKYCPNCGADLEELENEIRD